MHTIPKCRITEWLIQIVGQWPLQTAKKVQLIQPFCDFTDFNESLLLHNTGRIYPNLSNFSFQLLNFPCLGGVEREEAEVYKSAHL